MSRAIQRRRGTVAQHSTFTGLAGEITVDTDNSRLRVHDGSTPGGKPVGDFVFNVLDSGATGDGTTDDSAAIQAAIDAVAANGGGVCFMPFGTFRAEGLLIKAQVHLMGAGPNATKLEAVGTTGEVTVIGNTSNSSRVSNFRLSNFSVDGRRTAGMTSGKSLVELVNVGHFTLDHVIVSNPYTHCFSLSNARHGLVSKCQALKTNTYTAYADDGFSIGETGEVAANRSHDVRFIGCYARGFDDNGNQSGFEADDGPYDIHYISCHAEDCNFGFTAHTHTNDLPMDDIAYDMCTNDGCVMGFVTHARTGAHITGLKYSKCISRNFTSYGFRVLNIDSGEVRNPHLIDCTADTGDTAILNQSEDIIVERFQVRSCTTAYDNTPDYRQLWCGNSPEIEPFTWTPTLKDASANAATYTTGYAVYRRTPDNNIRAEFRLSDITTTGMTAGDNLLVGNFPGEFGELGWHVGTVLMRSIGHSGGSLVFMMQSLEAGLIDSMEAAGGHTYVTVGDITSGSNELMVKVEYQQSAV